MSHAAATALEVPAGSPNRRRLVERAGSIGGAIKLADDFMIVRVTPR